MYDFQQSAYRYGSDVQPVQLNIGIVELLLKNV